MGLVSTYIEALLANERSADLVWEAWRTRQISDAQAAQAWLAVSASLSESTNEGPLVGQ